MVNNVDTEEVSYHLMSCNDVLSDDKKKHILMPGVKEPVLNVVHFHMLLCRTLGNFSLMVVSSDFSFSFW